MALGITLPRCSMYGISTYIYPKNGPNVGKYSIHGVSGLLPVTVNGIVHGPKLNPDPSQHALAADLLAIHRNLSLKQVKHR